MDSLQAFLTQLNWVQWKGAEFDQFSTLYAEVISAATEETEVEKTKEAVKLVEEVAPTYSFVQLSDIYGFKDNLNYQVWNQNSLLIKDLKFE